MAASVSTVITRGYGNGTQAGDTALVITRGYGVSTVVPVVIRQQRHTGTGRPPAK